MKISPPLVKAMLYSLPLQPQASKDNNTKTGSGVSAISTLNFGNRDAWKWTHRLKYANYVLKKASYLLLIMARCVQLA